MYDIRKMMSLCLPFIMVSSYTESKECFMAKLNCTHTEISVCMGHSHTYDQ